MSGTVGRPKGSKNKIEFRNWQPKKWTAVYESILFLHLSGKSNVDISKMMEYSEVQIGNILNCELARGRINEIRKRVEEKNKDVGERLNQVLDKAVDRLYDYVHNDKVFSETPNAAMDRTIKAIELVRPRGAETITNNTLVLASEHNIGKLLEAANMANKAKEINAGSYTVVSTTGNKTGIGDPVTSG